MADDSKFVFELNPVHFKRRLNFRLTLRSKNVRRYRDAFNFYALRLTTLQLVQVPDDYGIVV